MPSLDDLPQHQHQQLDVANNDTEPQRSMAMQLLRPTPTIKKVRVPTKPSPNLTAALSAALDAPADAPHDAHDPPIHPTDDTTTASTTTTTTTTTITIDEPSKPSKPARAAPPPIARRTPSTRQAKATAAILIAAVSPLSSRSPSPTRMPIDEPPQPLPPSQLATQSLVRHQPQRPPLPIDQTNDIHIHICSDSDSSNNNNNNNSSSSSDEFESDSESESELEDEQQHDGGAPTWAWHGGVGETRRRPFVRSFKQELERNWFALTEMLLGTRRPPRGMWVPRR